MNGLEFLEMKQNQIDESGKLIARAFEDYRYISNYISDDRRRKKFVDIIMPIEIKVNHESIDFIAKLNYKIVAVAMLYSPGKKRAGDIAYYRAGVLRAFLYGGVLDVNAWVNMDKKASAPCHNIVGNVWYLSLLTVDPEFQGRGIGSKFLSDCIIPYVRKEGGEKLSLFTNTERNLEFYVKNGFKQFDYREFYYKGRKLPSFSMIIDV